MRDRLSGCTPRRIVPILAMLMAGGLAVASAPAQTIVEVRVGADSDDAEEESGGGVSLNNDKLELGEQQYVGLRFQNVTVPQGETITSAYVQFRAAKTDSDTTDLTIFGQDADTAATFGSGSGNLSARTMTTASVSWNSVENWTEGQTYQTPSITAVLQEIVNRPGWTSGNDIVILIRSDDLDGQRRVDSHDDTSANSPLLHVEYGAASSTVYYVRTDGNDSNSGTGPSTTEAWRTVSAAVDKTVVNSGDVVYVKSGTYTGQITPSVDGTSGSPIRFVGDSDGAIFGDGGGEVILDGDGSNTTLYAEDDDYLHFENFTILGEDDQGAYWEDSVGGVLRRVEFRSASKRAVRLKGNSSSLLVVNCLVKEKTNYSLFTEGGDLTVWHCTVIGSGKDGVHTHGGTTTVYNSIFAFNTEYGIRDHGGAIVHDYNLVYGNGTANFRDTTQSANEITADPLFAAADDFHLGAGSPAIDAATDGSSITLMDLDSLPRPIAASWDMGCYEQSLVAQWPFDEGAGTTSADVSLNGHDASLMLSTWTTARCQFAVQLDGVASWIDLGQIELGTSGYTIAAWFKTPRRSQQTIFAATAAGTSNHLIILETTPLGYVQLTHRYPVGASGGTTLSNSSNIADDRWHFVTAVKDADTLRLYVDGELVDQSSDTTGVESSLDMVLGKLGATLDQQYFQGTIDEVTVYGAGLSAAEVGNLFGLVGHWRLDESSGTVALNSTVFANDGALAGSPVWMPNDGQIDGALQFDGSADYVAVPANATLNFGGDATISGWFKLSSSFDATSATSRIVVEKYLDGNNNMLVVLAGTDYGQASVDDGALVFKIESNGAVRYIWTNRIDWAASVWYHFSAVHYSTDPSTSKIYIDGVDDTAPTSSGSGTGNSLDFSADFRIGGKDSDSQLSGARYFPGLIDDVRIYDRALCNDELVDLHAGGGPRGVWVIKWEEVK